MLALAVGIQAQTVSVKMNRALLSGNALSLDMDVRIPYIDVKRNESLQLTLALVENTTRNRRSKRLPPIIVLGANKRNMYKRSVALAGDNFAKKGAYSVLKADKEVIQFVALKGKVAYQPWMNNCQVVLVGEVKNYKDKTISRFSNVIQKKLVITK